MRPLLHASRQFGVCRLASIGILALVADDPSAVRAADTLAQAIAKADSEHVSAEESALPPDESPKLTTGWDEEPGQGQTRAISAKNIKVAITYRKVEKKKEDGAAVAEAEPEAPPPSEDAEPPLPEEEAAKGAPDDNADAEAAEAEAVAEEEEPQYQVPIVTVTVSGRQVARLEGEDISWEVPPVGVQIAEMSPGNPYPEVVVSFYTGGAHCCSLTKVVTSNRSGRKWDVVDVGQFDGGPQMATDLDGDGRYEFADRDNAFLTAFGCYACSSAPLKVLRLEDTAIKTVSDDPRYRAAHVAWLKEMVAQAQADEVDANAFLAGYVAQKILLGEGAEAWAIMEDHYNSSSSDGLEQCEQLPVPDGNCPGRTVRRNFPASLAVFLNLRGYPAKF